MISSGILLIGFSVPQGTLQGKVFKAMAALFPWNAARRGNISPGPIMPGTSQFGRKALVVAQFLCFAACDHDYRQS